MSGIQSTRSMPITVTQPKDVTPKATNTSAVDNSNTVSISVSKDNISNLGKGLVAGSVPAAGIAIAIKVSGTAVEHMGDGGLGLGMALMGAKPAVAASLAGGAVGALFASGKPLKGSIAGTITGAITGGTLAMASYKNPILGAIGAVTGGIAGGISGGAASYITKK